MEQDQLALKSLPAAQITGKRTMGPKKLQTSKQGQRTGSTVEHVHCGGS